MLRDVWRQLDRVCLRAFGTDLVYMPEAGGAYQVRGIFQRSAEPEDSVPGTYAVVFVRVEDLPDAPIRGDRIVINGDLYMAYDIEADGSGAILMRLRRV